MSKILVPTQPLAQAQSLLDLTEPHGETDASVEVTCKSRRSTSVKRS